VDSTDEIVELLGEDGLGSNSLDRQSQLEGAMGALLGDSAELAARLGDPRLELDTVSRTYLLLGAVLQRASASPAQSVVDVLAMLSATQSALGTMERAEFLTGVALARVRTAEASADDVDVIGVLRDNSLRIGFPTRVRTTLGTVIESLGQVQGQPLVDLLLNDDFTLDNVARSTYLLGVAAERAGLIPSSQMAEEFGSGWGLLGHLFDPALEVETTSRALFLLGAATERSSTSPEEVLQRLHDPYWAMGLGDKAVVLLVAASLRPTVAIDAGTFLGGSAAALSMFAERVITIDVDAARERHIEELANVEFVCGVAAEVLEELLPSERSAELVVLDAAHTADGIVAEVEQLLKSPPTRLRAVLIHDSAMQMCRDGLDSVDWEGNPVVRGATLDFVPGEVSKDGLMGGGLAVVWLLE